MTDTNTPISYTNADRDAAARDASTAKANADMARMVEEFHNSTEQRIVRDRAELNRLQSDPYTLDKSRREIEVLEGRIAANTVAVVQTEAERVEAIIRGDAPIAGAEVTMGDQIPRRDLADAVGDILERGVRPGLIETFLKTGRGDDPAGRDAEIAAAREWRRRLDVDPEMQRKLLAKDPEMMDKLAKYAIYAPWPHER